MNLPDNPSAGVAINEKLGDSIIVTVIATGFDAPSVEEPRLQQVVTPRKEEPRTSYTTVKEEKKEGSPRFFQDLRD